jgi:muconate cycloisomerase
MATLAGVEMVLVELPTRRKHVWTGLTEPIGRYLLVKVADSEGRVGWGEAPALKDWGGEFGRYYGESASIVSTVITSYLGPAVLGIDLGNAADLHQRMDAVIKGYPYAKAAIDLAFYDLTGRAFGLSVHTLLGGASRLFIPVTHSIGLVSIQEAEAEAAKVVSEGFKTIKIKVGRDSKRDVDVVHRVRATVGPGVNLCVDANEGYATPGLAIRTIRKMQEFDLLYVEQPVSGIERMAEVARAVDVPLMADESAWNGHDVIQIIAQQAAQIVSIYTTKPGGLYRAMEVAATCRSAGIICNVNGSVETGVGNLANVHLAAAASAATVSSVIPVSTPAEFQNGQVGGIYYLDDLIKQPLVVKDGAIQVPTAPGMGIDVDENKLVRYRVENHKSN